MDEEGKAFLGRGWSFPPVFDRINNAVQLSSGIDDIEESIRIILGTTPGERIMQPKFGCDLKKLVFEQLSLNLVTQINHMIGNALLNFEPRIEFIRAEVLDQAAAAGMIHLRIDYSVIITNTRHNMVYPFYLTEGTNLAL